MNSWTHAWSLLPSKSKLAIFVLFVGRIASNFLDMLAVTGFGLVVAHIVSNAPLELPLFDFVLPKGSEGFNSANLVLGVIILVFVSRSAVGMMVTVASNKILARTEATVASRLANSTFSGTLEDFEELSKGEVEWALNRSVQSAISGQLSPIMTLASEGFLLFLLASAVVVSTPVQGIWSLLSLGILLAAYQVAIRRKARTIGHHLHTAAVRSRNAVQEIMTGFRELASQRALALHLETFSRYRLDFALLDASQRTLKSLPRFIFEPIIFTVVSGYVVLNSIRTEAGGLAPELGILIAASLRIVSVILPMQAALVDLKLNRLQARSALLLLAKPQNEISEPSRVPQADATAKPCIKIKNLAYVFPGSNIEIISNISVEINKPGLIGIVGESGSGKTTFAELVAGLRRPTSGSIAVSSQGLDQVARPGLVAYVPTNPQALDAALAENVALGKLPESISAALVVRSLQDCQLGELLLELKGDIWQRIGPSTRSLSTGQLQRLGIARSIYSGAEIIILDEPTSGLDSENADAIMNLLKRLSNRRIVICITHDRLRLNKMDRVIDFDEPNWANQK